MRKLTQDAGFLKQRNFLHHNVDGVFGKGSAPAPAHSGALPGPRLAGHSGDYFVLELSREKTLITRARTDVARFLGYEIVTLNADDKHDYLRHRCINGVPGLKVPLPVRRLFSVPIAT